MLLSVALKVFDTCAALAFPGGIGRKFVHFTNSILHNGKTNQYCKVHREVWQHGRLLPQREAMLPQPAGAGEQKPGHQALRYGFRNCSKAGKLVRYALKQELSIHHDSDLTNRLNTSLLQVLYAGDQQRGSRSIQRKYLASLAGLKLNNHTELGRLLPFTGR